ncbi:MAG TPA: O-antigen ligase family protein [Terriglobales bacterium]|nr:O-antigen ligase family protein [Terriglobales bacterium]
MGTAATSAPKTSAAASARGGWAFWAALAPTLAAIVGFGGVYSYVWVPVDVALFIGLAVLLWLRLVANHRFVGHALLWPVAGFGVLALAQWRFRLSVYPGATLTELVQLAACAAVFYLTLHACRNRHWIHRLGWILWLFCGMVTVEALFQIFDGNGFIYWFHDAGYATPVGPFVYHNFYAGCMDLLFPVTVAVAFRADSSGDPTWVAWLRRGLVPALCLVSVVVSRSRGGILTLFAEVLLGLWVFWPDLKRKRGARRTLLLCVLVMLGVGLLANWGPLVQRFGYLDNHDASVVQRLSIDQSSWHIFLDHPLVGTGFNTFSAVYPAYQLFDNGLVLLYAHNEYAQMLAETGMVGALNTLAFLVIWGWAFLRRRRRLDADEALRNLQLAAFIGTAGFLIQSFGDFEFHAPGNALLFFLLCAAAVVAPRGNSPAPDERARSRRRTADRPRPRPRLEPLDRRPPREFARWDARGPRER